MSEQLKQKEPTNYCFKILYVLGIIFVVSGHCGNGGFSLMYEWFPQYSFHLGLFAFASGYFYKKNAENQVGKYILKKVKTLLVPLYLWNLFYAVVVLVLSVDGFTIGAPVTWEKLLLLPITDGHQFSYNLGGWFVIPLFMVQVYNVLVRKVFDFFKIKVNEWIYFLFGVVLGIAGVSLAAAGYHEGWWLVLVRMLYFIPFFSLGTLYKEKLEKHDNLPNIWYFTIVLGISALIILKFGHMPNYVPSWCRNFTDGPVMPFVVGFLGIAFWFRIARVLEPAIGKSKYIGLIAANTYAIMIHHLMAFMVVKTVFGLVKRFTSFCQDFSLDFYRSDVWYIYVPNEAEQLRILYLAAGIVLPVILQLVINKVGERIKEKAGRKKTSTE